MAMRTLCRVQAVLLALVSLLVVGGLGFSARLALGALVHEGLLQHADVLVQLVVQLPCAPNLALLLRDLGLHLGALNVPRVPGALVVVPLELQEAHDACRLSAASVRPHHMICAATGAYPAKCTLSRAAHCRRLRRPDRPHSWPTATARPWRT